jgi:uncharacterized protein YjbI with pentapeptide repeats
MANPEHLALLRQGVDVWNAWRKAKRLESPDLRGADLTSATLRGFDLTIAKLNEANLSKADLSEADLEGADLIDADLSGAWLFGTNLYTADLSRADLHGANFRSARLEKALLVEANFSDAKLYATNLTGADLFAADLRKAVLDHAVLREARLDSANLAEASLFAADLSKANLRAANLSGANLREATLVGTNLSDAILTGCQIYGISAWNVKLSDGTKQQNLVITSPNEPEVTVDNIEVAQFVYLLLHNEKIRDIIDTVGKKGVLLLGRFTEGRLAVLDRLREELRKRGYLPIVFNFDKPETKDFTETVRLLAGLSKFVIADITNPKSTPLELQATVPEIMVPFRPIIEAGEKPFAMLQDLWIKHREWVFEPIYYSSVDALIASLDEKIIKPAEARFSELLKRKADTMGGEHV